MITSSYRTRVLVSAEIQLAGFFATFMEIMDSAKDETGSLERRIRN
jgi:hypothetical protein